jgi:hypothetical protein
MVEYVRNSYPPLHEQKPQAPFFRTIANTKLQQAQLTAAKEPPCVCGRIVKR